jgi:hypothetical protein
MKPIYININNERKVFVMYYVDIYFYILLISVISILVAIHSDKQLDIRHSMCGEVAGGF